MVWPLPSHPSERARSVRVPLSLRQGARDVSDCARPTFSLEGGLDGLPLRVSNEGLLRPRVARAQETI
jgi:hypothetical protein